MEGSDNQMTIYIQEMTRTQEVRFFSKPSSQLVGPPAHLLSMPSRMLDTTTEKEHIGMEGISFSLHT
jgi:hypothetical protein